MDAKLRFALTLAAGAEESVGGPVIVYAGGGAPTVSAKDVVAGAGAPVVVPVTVTV